MRSEQGGCVDIIKVLDAAIIPEWAASPVIIGAKCVWSVFISSTRRWRSFGEALFPLKGKGKFICEARWQATVFEFVLLFYCKSVFLVFLSVSFCFLKKNNE